MLSPQYRDLLVQTMLRTVPVPLDCQNLVNSVRPGSWNAIAPIGAAYANVVPLLVDAADAQNWLRDLVQRLVDNFGARTEFAAILLAIDRTGIAGSFDPYEFLDQFDRSDERDQLAQDLMDFAVPPPINPIAIAILAELSDEYTYFVRRINSDVLKSIYQDAPWPDEFITWSKTATAEFEIRKIAGRKLGSERGEIGDLIARLGPAIAGRSMRIELRSDALQQPATLKKLEDFLSLWGKLGAHAPPPVLYVVVVRYSDGDLSLEKAQAFADPVFERMRDQLVTVKPIMLSLCDLGHFEAWQEALTAMGKRVDPLAYNRLKNSIGKVEFRLRDLMTQLEANRIY